MDEELPDVQKRFNLEESTVKITSTKKYSLKFVGIFGALVFFGTVWFVSKTKRTQDSVDLFRDLESRVSMVRSFGGDRREIVRALDYDVEERQEFIRFKQEEFEKKKFDFFEPDSLD